VGSRSAQAIAPILGPLPTTLSGGAAPGLLRPIDASSRAISGTVARDAQQANLLNPTFQMPYNLTWKPRGQWSGPTIPR
jgi:hypothetical protein